MAVRGACSLGALLLAGCALNMHQVQVGTPLPVEVKLTPGRTSYGQVLEYLGPPAAVAGFDHQAKFAFLYDHLRVVEWMVQAQYQNGKVSYSTGDQQLQAILIAFAGNGKLLYCSPVDESVDLGWGGIIGHSYAPELFFRFRDYLTKDTTRQRRGATLLDPSGSQYRIEAGQAVVYDPSVVLDTGR